MLRLCKQMEDRRGATCEEEVRTQERIYLPQPASPSLASPATGNWEELAASVGHGEKHWVGGQERWWSWKTSRHDSSTSSFHLPVLSFLPPSLSTPRRGRRRRRPDVPARWVAAAALNEREASSGAEKHLQWRRGVARLICCTSPFPPQIHLCGCISGRKSI